jgi:hypothetical protein
MVEVTGIREEILNLVAREWDGRRAGVFPRTYPTRSTVINDDVALDLTLRAPTNATGFKYDFKFYSNEYPEWVCTTYNDQFIALVNPAGGSAFGNITLIDANPVSVNIAFFDVCDPADIGDFAGWCKMTSTAVRVRRICIVRPQLAVARNGFRYAGWDSGATSWLKSTASVTGGGILDSLAIWDTGDWNLIRRSGRQLPVDRRS